MSLRKLTTEKQIPINRNSLFYSQESFDYDMMMAKSYVENDMNQTVILYEVDLENTNRDALYNEAKKDEIQFKTPKEIHVVYELDEPELRAYKERQSLGSYVKLGKLTFGVFQYTLDELECDIKRGDYIGLQVTPTHREYFTVVDDGRINYDNKHTKFGTVPFYRTVICSSVSTLEEFGEKQ